jgi:hypothetical protein
MRSWERRPDGGAIANIGPCMSPCIQMMKPNVRTVSYGESRAIERLSEPTQEGNARRSWLYPDGTLRPSLLMRAPLSSKIYAHLLI